MVSFFINFLVLTYRWCKVRVYIIRIRRVLTILKDKLDDIYKTYNKRKYVDPDPLLFLYDYPEKKNREIAGFIAAGFAYGRVEMIMKTVGSILKQLGSDPFGYLMERSGKDMADQFKGFRHRFANEDDLVNLLKGLHKVIVEFSSLENCFYAGMKKMMRQFCPVCSFCRIRFVGKSKSVIF